MTVIPLNTANEPIRPAVGDADIHARAWAMVESVIDSVPERLALLHAAAMLMASLAHGQTDPIAACEEMLADQSAETMGILRAALTLDSETSPSERKS